MRATFTSTRSRVCSRVLTQVIKQATVSFLSHRGIKKGDPEFTDFYQTIYRGVVFALVCLSVLPPCPITSQSTHTCVLVQRAIMRTQAVKLNAVDKLCPAHWRLYAEGNGESSSSR